jgi:transcriptional regulator with XRE-family HTH domain
VRVKRTPAELLGICIRDRRIDSGMSQVEFGEKCGFYQTYLSRIENGRANPSLNAFQVIATALGISVFDLFEEASRVLASNNKPVGRPLASAALRGVRQPAGGRATRKKRASGR